MTDTGGLYAHWQKQLPPCVDVQIVHDFPHHHQVNLRCDRCARQHEVRVAREGDRRLGELKCFCFAPQPDCPFAEERYAADKAQFEELVRNTDPDQADAAIEAVLENGERAREAVTKFMNQATEMDAPLEDLPPETEQAPE